jgi:FkbM family methyltransferase
MKKDTIRGHTFIPSYLTNDSYILDLGSHKGEFSLELAKKYDYKKIITIEANPELVKITRKNTSSVRDIIVIEGMISSSTNSSSDFYINSNLPEASSAINEIADEQWWFTEETNNIDYKPIKRILVSNYNLHDLIKKYEINEIGLIKMDVEGSEWDILNNFDENLAKKVKQISVEFHDFYGKKYREKSASVIHHLKQLGYKFEHKPGFWGFGTPYADCIFYK